MTGVKYYQQPVAKNGPGTTDFLRLFMVPGMSHCGGGSDTDLFDPMTVIVDWVEKGRRRIPSPRRGGQQQGGAHPPAVRVSAGGARSRPGSIDDAANFRCVAP